MAATGLPEPGLEPGLWRPPVSPNPAWSLAYGGHRSPPTPPGASLMTTPGLPQPHPEPRS